LYLNMRIEPGIAVGAIPSSYSATARGPFQQTAAPTSETVAFPKRYPRSAIAAALFETTASGFLAHEELQNEVFSAAGIVVHCRDFTDIETVIDALEGQLTVALFVNHDDEADARRLVPKLEMLAGRLFVNGFGTGVEVSPAMVHGGPDPATADGRSTSVGTLAIYRFFGLSLIRISRPDCFRQHSGT